MSRIKIGLRPLGCLVSGSACQIDIFILDEISEQPNEPLEFLMGL
jgi:hypothetical protein